MILNALCDSLITLYICNAFDWTHYTSNPENCHSPPPSYLLLEKRLKAHSPVALGFF